MEDQTELARALIARIQWLNVQLKPGQSKVYPGLLDRYKAGALSGPKGRI